MPATIRDQPAPRLQMEAKYNGPLSPVQMQVIALLVEGGRTMEQLAQEVGWDRQTIWRWRKKPEFQAEYLRQLRAVEQQAFDYGISRRVERIAAINEVWLRLREEIRSGKKLRTDQIYALASLHADARKELGIADNVNVKMDITEPIKVIRFEAQEPRRELPEPDTIDADYHETTSASDPDAQFRAVLREAGVRMDQGSAQPADLAAIGNAIRESGLDPREVLSDSQYRVLYGRGKQDDPWA